ncbi:nacht nucleoside triphosphatase [Fusarium napiforme]|uniref:Nacht nucleoside triphosphatase n=1 Tax=Fusarium napiforme TaxID=42672 RepID=A0A8H5MRM7_9HYPO|nr:nacht nucleoside triphosphatase [Fusarium napiforme]
MELLAALGLASNVVQFVSFASDLISSSIEIHGSISGCSERVLALDTLYGQLGDLSAALKTCSDSSLNFSSRELAKSVSAIKNMSHSCKEDCDRLLEIVQQLKAKSGSKGVWKSFRTALRTLWEKKRIAGLEDQLNKHQVALTLQICAISSHWHDDHERALKKMQLDAHVLHLNQSKKLEQISDALSQLDARIASVKPNPQDNPFTSIELAKLEEQFRHVALSEDVVAKEQAVLRTLLYECLPVRHNSIPEAHEQTFRWIFQQSREDATHESKLVTWLRKGNGIFWISGKPGSGKSTLMKFIAGEQCTRTTLRAWAKPKSAVIASHFFWSAGTAMQKSQEGLLRSLLYDIFRQFPDLIEQSCPKEWLATINQTQESIGHPNFWTLSELHKSIRRVANREALSGSLCFFIDGLDEYDGDHFELCRTLQDLAKSRNIKICLSSRPWPVFEEAFGSDALHKFYIHELTKGDIQRYSKSRLHEHPRWPHLASDPAQAQWLVEEITERASGVFLWVFLVTKLLREGLTNRDSFSDLIRRLESFPLELDVFFRQILESVDPFYHCKMSTTLQIATAAEEPLYAYIYAFHDMEHDNADYASHLPLRPLTQNELSEMTERMSWQLNSRCRGLLEVNDQSGTVTFLHRTVMDFLKTRQMSDFLRTKGSSNFSADLCLLKACTASFKLGARHARLRNDKTISISPLETPPSLDALLKDVLVYAARIEEQGNGHENSAFKILNHLEQSISKMECTKVYKYFRELPSEFKFRNHLIDFQLVNYLHRKLLSQPNYLQHLGQDLVPEVLTMSGYINIKGPWKSKGCDILRYVLETGINIDDKNADELHNPWVQVFGHVTSWVGEDDEGRRSELQARFWAMMESRSISLALKNGADPNVLIRRCSMKPFVYSTAWVDFLLLSFDIPANPARESLYLQVLDNFIDAGADMKATPLIVVSEGRATEAKGENTVHKKFFGLLEHGAAIKSGQYNLPLLAEVTHTLLLTAHKEELEWPMDDIWNVIDKAFPPQLSARIRLRHTKLSRGPKDSGGIKNQKRKRETYRIGRTSRRKLR